MKTINEISAFGATDADNDQILFQAFEDHEAHEAVRARERFLIVGRKGSGKTAIFKRLVGIRQPDYFCFGHTFSDYPWHHHDLQARIGIPDADKYTHSWKYLILLTLAKVILNQDQSLPYDDTSMEAMARIERFVTDTYGSRDPDVTQVFTPTKQLRLRPHFEFDARLLKAGISPESVPMTELPTIVQDVNRNLTERCLDCLRPDHEYFICFDQLDLGFDPQRPEYNSRLIGLLLASKDLNLVARDRRRRFFVAVFLRTDIYESLHFEDKNKLTENFLSAIEWDTHRTTKTLQQLMGKRFTTLLQSEPGERVAWDDVFDEANQMPGRQSKYQHMLDRTFLRPRDIIRFCNSVLKQYKLRLADSKNDGPSKFANIDISRARPEYSDYLLAELDDEIFKHLPDYKLSLEILKEIGVWQFSQDEFEQACASPKFEGRLPGHPSKILESLFAFSLVGFYSAGGRGYGGSEWVFRHKDPNQAFDTTATRFRIHPGYIEVLGLKRFTHREKDADDQEADDQEADDQEADNQEADNQEADNQEADNQDD
jgi:hypothetical protein